MSIDPLAISILIVCVLGAVVLAFLLPTAVLAIWDWRFASGRTKRPAPEGLANYVQAIGHRMFM